MFTNTSMLKRIELLFRYANKVKVSNPIIVQIYSLDT